jgi:hypothetical protein
MKPLSLALGVLVAVLLAALVLQYRKSLELETSLLALTHARDEAARRIKALDAEVLEQRRRTEAMAKTVALTPPPAARTETAEIARPTKLEPVERPGVTVKAPPGWGKNGSKPGSYVVGVDSLQTWGGMPSAYVQNIDGSKDGFGGMMQMAAAENYVGKRVRLSGWVKTEDANDGGGRLWLRVDGEQAGRSLQFDNMNNRPVKGTSDWQEASVVLDVPAGATALAYGFFVQGGGKMWVSGARMEEVGPDVPTTNMLPPQTKATVAAPRYSHLPKTPVNLGFSPPPPSP